MTVDADAARRVAEAEQRAAELKERLEKNKHKFANGNGNGSGVASPPTPEPEFDPADVPELENIPRSEVDVQIDNVIANIDIVDAYKRFCGKMEPKVGSKTESIMISCPNPSHPDQNPSAWINTDKQTWFCGGCQFGGDIFDIAAYHFGYDVNGYKNNGTFPSLRRDIASSYGYTVVKGIKEEYLVEDPAIEEPEPEEDETPHLAPVIAHPSAPVPEPDLYTESQYDDLYIDWQSWVPKNTFLHDWLTTTTVDDLPHEYYLWLGLQALGFACGNYVTLIDFIPVKPNLNVCLYGGTGTGKSRAINPFVELLKKALPFDPTDLYSDPLGTLILPMPGSAESLVDLFHHDVLDPSTNKVDHIAPINGLLKIDEFSSFINKASRPGSNLKEVIIELYDIHGSDLSLKTRTSGLTIARNPFCQIVTTTQPKAISAFLKRTDTESGMLNRFIFAPGRPRRAPIAYGGVAIDVTDAALALKRINIFAKRRHNYDLTGDALEYWESFFATNIAPLKLGNMDSMAVRIDLTLKKLIVTLAANSVESQPSLESVVNACKLFKYLFTSYSIFGSDISYTESSACQERITEIILKLSKRDKDPTKRDIVQYVGKKFESELIEKTLKTMVNLEIVSESIDKKPGRGRPTVRYSVAN